MICPDCKNSFLQPFVCTTCGAEKLYYATVETLRNQLAAAIEQRDEMRLALRDLTGAFADYGGPTYANVYINALIALGWTAATGECETRAMSIAAAICATKQFGAHIKEMHEFIEENQRLIKLSEGITQTVTPTVKESLTVQEARKLVWLTDAEAAELWAAVDSRDILELIRKVQARLKEKNT